MAATNRDLCQKLIDSAQRGDLAGVVSLLAQGADARSLGSKALCEAVNNGHVECVKLLIPVSDPKDNDSRALRWAAHNGHAECVKLLIPVSDINACSKSLGLAARFGHTECLRLLLPVSHPDDRPQALQDAIAYRNNECAKLLIPAQGSLLKSKNTLASVFFHGRADLLSLMLACEPLILTGFNTPRQREIAIANGHNNLARLLSSVIEQEALSADLPPSSARDAPAPRRL